MKRKLYKSILIVFLLALSSASTAWAQKMKVDAFPGRAKTGEEKQYEQYGKMAEVKCNVLPYGCKDTAEVAHYERDVILSYDKGEVTYPRITFDFVVKLPAENHPVWKQIKEMNGVRGLAIDANTFTITVGRHRQFQTAEYAQSIVAPLEPVIGKKLEDGSRVSGNYEDGEYVPRDVLFCPTAPPSKQKSSQILKMLKTPPKTKKK